MIIIAKNYTVAASIAEKPIILEKAVANSRLSHQNLINKAWPNISYLILTNID